MKRAFIVTILLIVIFIGGGSLVILNLDQIISSVLSKKLDVKTSLKKLTFTKDNIDLTSFKIENPKNSSIKDAIKIEKLNINAPFTQLLANPIVIDEIALDTVYVSLILSRDNKSACNWNILYNNMSTDDPKWYSIQRTALIKHLILKNVTIELQMFGKSPQTLSPIEKIEFHNIDVDKGIPTKEISNIIVSKMIGSIFSLSSIKSILGLPFNAVESIFKKGSSDDGSDPCPMYKDYNTKEPQQDQSK